MCGCQPAPVVQAEAPKPEPAVVQPSSEPIVPTGRELQSKSKDPRYKVERIHQLIDLEKRTMKVGNTTLTVWLMDDDSKRAEGMMWLVDKDVKDTEGMLFIFKDAATRGFWMQNCPLGLDISYIDPKGKVLNVGEGKPYSEETVPCKGQAQYVLELKVGRAKKFGIHAGTILTLPEHLTAKE